MIEFVLAFVVATVVSVVLSGLVRRFATAIGAVVPPRADRWHSAPTPTLGGIAIAAATTLAVVAASVVFPESFQSPTWIPILAAGLAMFAIGMLDDRVQLSPLAKLVSSLIVGAFLVFWLTRRPDASLPLGYTLVATVWFAGRKRLASPWRQT